MIGVSVDTIWNVPVRARSEPPVKASPGTTPVIVSTSPYARSNPLSAGNVQVATVSEVRVISVADALASASLAHPLVGDWSEVRC